MYPSITNLANLSQENILYIKINLISIFTDLFKFTVKSIFCKLFIPLYTFNNHKFVLIVFSSFVLEKGFFYYFISNLFSKEKNNLIMCT